MGQDLLGDDAPATPPMDAPLPWRVFKLSDYEWYAARTLEEAKEVYARDMGYQQTDPEFLDLVEGAYELSDEALLALRFRDEDRPGFTYTFRDELDRQVARGMCAPGFFAGSED